MRGGGIHGSFEVGVLKGLVDNMPPKEIGYDYVAGVSIGAYNAAYFATIPIGSEKEAVEKMLETWNMDTSDLFSFYNPKWLTPFRRTYITNNENFEKKIKDSLGDRPLQRKLSILSADLHTG